MKKAKLAILTASALALLCGCDDKTLPKVQPKNVSDIATWYSYPAGLIRVYSLKIDGHDYLALTTGNAASMIHSNSCPCMNKRRQDHENE